MDIHSTLKCKPAEAIVAEQRIDTHIKMHILYALFSLFLFLCLSFSFSIFLSLFSVHVFVSFAVTLHRNMFLHSKPFSTLHIWSTKLDKNETKNCPTVASQCGIDSRARWPSNAFCRMGGWANIKLEWIGKNRISNACAHPTKQSGIQCVHVICSHTARKQKTIQTKKKMRFSKRQFYFAVRFFLFFLRSFVFRRIRFLCDNIFSVAFFCRFFCCAREIEFRLVS